VRTIYFLIVIYLILWAGTREIERNSTEMVKINQEVLLNEQVR
jgi:hypothetical protein